MDAFKRRKLAGGKVDRNDIKARAAALRQKRQEEEAAAQRAAARAKAAQEAASMPPPPPRAAPPREVRKVSLARAPAPAAPPPGPPAGPPAGLPAGFFDASGGEPAAAAAPPAAPAAPGPLVAYGSDDDDDDDDDDEAAAAAPAPAPAPAPAAPAPAEGSALPAGFFDDASADLRARGIDPEAEKARAASDAWAQFQQFAGAVRDDEAADEAREASEADDEARRRALDQAWYERRLAPLLARSDRASVAADEGDAAAPRLQDDADGAGPADVTAVLREQEAKRRAAATALAPKAAAALALADELSDEDDLNEAFWQRRNYITGE